MSNYFTLELDTTGPFIYISSPSYTSTESMNEIVVQANELLSQYQDFYFIDALGNRHDAIFSYEDDKFVGSYRFNDFPPGIAILYAQVKDVVNNPSNIATAAINVITTSFKAKIGVKDRKIKCKVKDRKTPYSVIKRKVKTDYKDRKIAIGLEVIENDG